MKVRLPFVPASGANQTIDQTPANQWAMAAGMRLSTPRRAPAKRASAKRAAPAKRANGSSRAAAKRPARLVKGSAAAKRYMAALRRKRRK